MPRKKTKEERFVYGHCQWVGCHLAAEYPAPKAPALGDENPKRELLYFCLDHVREYNSTWDFFRGMREEEIMEFQKDAITGHRKTKKIRQHKKSDFIKNVRNFGASFIFENIFSEDEKPKERIINVKEKEALAVLDLEHPSSLKEIKLAYKKMVKKYHPDINGGSPAAEEKFKIINEAYNLLKNSVNYTN